MSVTYNAYIKQWISGTNRTYNPYAASIGSSGAGNATIVLFASLFPKTTFLLFFIIPCPAWLAAGGFIAYDVYNSISRGNPIIDSFAHLGGAGIGFGYYWFKLRPFLRRF
ncbi:hypothetical protein AYI70_g11521 [Smittium culicis]|uniref:Peptidase S54 rhomboid domain-containing protein n=1 Tax=Smittium culicis TaxID=133412 RepID=A0A1R1X1I7_9FUNG|nr:hypothetical protein AYI70_g11521 [Smittium culicis]